MSLLLLVATDKAPSSAFEKFAIATNMRERGEAATLIGHGIKISSGEVGSSFAKLNPGCVLIGMSSKEINSEGEIRACEIARERGIPYGFYADTYGAVTGRPQFTAALKEGASFLFVRNQTEADRARGHFPRSVIVVSGNVMQEDWFYPTATYEDVRRKMDVAPRELAVLCPSGKELVVNLIHFGAAIEAAKICRLERRMDMRVFLAIHPGDPKENYEHYLALARFSQSVPVRAVGKEIMSTGELLVGCDIVVASMSTVSDEAACQRKPVIDFMSDIALGIHEKTAGRRDWEPCNEGASFPVHGDTGALAHAMHGLLAEGSPLRVEQRKNQERMFPLPRERGEAVRLMHETIVKFLK